MTGRVRRRCAHLTLTATPCRRTAVWSLPGASRVNCWQHAVEVARNHGETRLVHWITGARRDVPPAPVRAEPDLPLPTGVDAIVRELNKVRTRRALARARHAICRDIAACHDPRGGLKHDVGVALGRAKSRVGVQRPTTSTGVSR